MWCYDRYDKIIKKEILEGNGEERRCETIKNLRDTPSLKVRIFIKTRRISVLLQAEIGKSRRRKLGLNYSSEIVKELGVACVSELAQNRKI